MGLIKVTNDIVFVIMYILRYIDYVCHDMKAQGTVIVSVASQL